MEVSEYDEELSKKIVNDITYLTKLYNTVIEAANIKTVRVNQSDDKIFIEYGSKSRTKRVVENKRNFDVEDGVEVASPKDIKIEYDPKNICITGGSALTIYDYYLKEYINAKELKNLESMTERKTSDIDMVWWPTYDNDRYAIISASEIIHNFVVKFKNSLEWHFTENFKGYGINVGSEIYRIARDGIIIQDNFSISEGYPRIEGYKYGTHQINIIFKFKNGVKCKMMDISIYDTASNQTAPKAPIEPMKKDPMYITNKIINKINISNTLFNVPIITVLEEQQKYAYKRRINRQNIYSKRLKYMNQLFKNIKNENLNTIKNDKLINTEYIYNIGKKNRISTYKSLKGNVYALSDTLPLTEEEELAQKKELAKYNKLVNERYIYYPGKKNKISTYKRYNGTTYSTKLSNIPLTNQEKALQSYEVYKYQQQQQPQPQQQQQPQPQQQPYRIQGIHNDRQYTNEYGRIFELHHIYNPKTNEFKYEKKYVGGKNKTKKNNKRKLQE
jgi:hypothetical protein